MPDIETQEYRLNRILDGSLKNMEVVRTADELAQYHGCELVPTMGALHEGHASLIRAARRGNRRAGQADGAGTQDRGPRGGAPGRVNTSVVVSIFVNPTQFGPQEDLATYPRTLEADLQLCRDCGADAVFVPDDLTIYPEGAQSAASAALSLPLPPSATQPRLEDACRPAHFGGVCQVVKRLFELAAPRGAYFGEKDWQQFRVISQMVESSRRTELVIVPCPTVRDADGLAMSSRNRYLTEEAREHALGLVRALRAGSALLEAGEQLQAVQAKMAEVIAAHGLSLEYAVARDQESLLPPRNQSRVRLLIAAKLGKVRLIDNCEVGDRAIGG